MNTHGRITSFICGIGLTAVVCSSYSLISSSSKKIQLIGNSAYLNFNYNGEEPVNLLDQKENQRSALVDITKKDAGAQYGFIHPTLRIPVSYETTAESQRLVEDLTMKMYRRKIKGAELEFIPDWFCEYDKNHNRTMESEEIKCWEADILLSTE